MKPDKHKQKKQNEYKRKHGITNKPANSDNKPERINPDSKQDKAQSSNENKQNATTILTTSTESDQTYCGRQSYNFQSANEEHDVELEETEELEIGEDLNEILKDTENTLFQYQYHQDSFFEEIGDYKHIDDKCSDVVSIQPSILSQILLGLPLYKRLDLEEDIFEPEDLMKMQAEAEKHLTTRNPPQNQVRTSNEEFLSEEMFESSRGNGEATRKTTTSNILKTEPSPIATKTLIDTQQDLTTEPEKMNFVASNPLPLTKESTKKHHKKINQVNKKSTMAELEDELDALLRL